MLITFNINQVCLLQTRLAAAESMTHDVIRDLLGVKMDITNYAVSFGYVFYKQEFFVCILLSLTLSLLAN